MTSHRWPATSLRICRRIAAHGPRQHRPAYTYTKIIDTHGADARRRAPPHHGVGPAGYAGPLAIVFRVRRTASTVQSNPTGGSMRELAADGYAFALQDIRGKYKSEGHFVMQRAPRNHSDPKAIDEGSDAYDTMEWLLKRVPGNNGRIGMIGVSYDGWLVVQALMDPHPAFKAASPQASPADMWMGDDFHHQGAFRLSYGFEYAYEMEHARTSPPASRSTAPTPTPGISTWAACRA